MIRTNLIGLTRLGTVLAVTMLIVACAKTITFEGGTPKNRVTVPGYLKAPEGDGPFPAIVLLHGCSGMSETAVHQGLERHAAALSDAGYITLIVNSHGARGISPAEGYRTTCRTGSQAIPRTFDAHAAARFLARRPDVKRTAIGVMGLSEGGNVALKAASGFYRSDNAPPFAAGVAFYPYCSPRKAWPYESPVLVLIGEADDITPAAGCSEMVEKVEQNAESGESEEMSLKLYPGVHHSFDLPLAKMYATPIGTVAPDYEAYTDAQDRMIAFFDRHLREAY